MLRIDADAHQGDHEPTMLFELSQLEIDD